MRSRLGAVALVVAATGAVMVWPASGLAARAGADARAARGAAGPAASVDAFTGTRASAPDFGTGGGAGNTFPGAVAPFGMLAWSPDTFPNLVNLGGGYTYADHELAGFSLTHLSGAGCKAAGDISFLPTTASVRTSPARAGSSDIESAYVPRFSHAQELALPGYYRVVLNPRSARALTVELTTATRAGEARLTYPVGVTPSLLVNAGASAVADTEASVGLDPGKRLITGSASAGRFCYQPNRYRVYFAARFDSPWRAYGTWLHQRLARWSRAARDLSPDASNYLPIPGGPPALPGDPSTTAQAGAYVTFARRRVVVHVGLSYVSVAGALRNLRAETGGTSFDTLHARATAAWNAALGLIRVSGGRPRERRMFYTALYHALLAPSVFSDADGRYQGMDGRVHLAGSGHVQYTNFSGWDIYRSEFPLLALIVPRRAADMARSLLAGQRQSGWLPKWPVLGDQTDVMTGDPADPILAEAWALGARGFSARAALAAMLKGATRPGPSSPSAYVERAGLAEYQRLGYVPHERGGDAATATFDHTRPWGSVSTTLEYAIDDFAIARMAAGVCDRVAYRRFLRRAHDWSRLFDPGTGLIAPRSAAGAFLPGTTPTSTADYAEGDASQYTWMVPHDVAGLVGRMGGRARALARLETFLSELNRGPAAPTAFLGNEPTLGTPWLFDWLGTPYRTQAVVRRALLSLYSPTPGGYPGNDDLGELSSWFVFGALGLYPAIPGTPLLALGSPLFPQAVLRLGRHSLTIDASGASPAAPYVRSLRVDGRALNRAWISASTLASVARLRFRLGPRPDRRWGAAPLAAPPSFGPSVPPSPCSAPR